MTPESHHRTSLLFMAGAQTATNRVDDPANFLFDTGTADGCYQSA